MASGHGGAFQPFGNYLGDTKSRWGACSSASLGFESRVWLGYTESVGEMNGLKPPGPFPLWAVWGQEKPKVTVAAAGTLRVLALCRVRTPSRWDYCKALTKTPRGREEFAPERATCKGEG